MSAVDQVGFPLVTCRRCAGTGEHGPVSINNGRCFDCAGSGLVWKRGKVAKAAVAYYAAVRTHQRPVIERIEVGDRVSTTGKRGSFRTVTGVAWSYLGGSGGSSVHGSVSSSLLWGRVELVFEAGEPYVSQFRTLVYRTGRPDVGPFLEAAGVKA